MMRTETTMSARNGEKYETGVDEQEQGSSKTPKRSRRWAFLMLALPIALLAWSCAPRAPLPVTPTNELAIGDAVIAVRLSGGQSRSGLAAPLDDNWIMLLDEQARQKHLSLERRREGTFCGRRTGFPTVGQKKIT